MWKLYSKGEKFFRFFALLFLVFTTIVVFLPFLLAISSSFTSEEIIIRKGYTFFPKKLSLEAYSYMFSQALVIFRAYGISISVTAIGTLVSLVITTMLAYPMSRPDFKYRNLLSFLVFFTLLFSGGVVPSYIMWTRLFNMKDSFLALIIPTYLMNGFNVLLVRNYYKSAIPISIIESAQIDGAGEFRIFFKIMVPLSLPVNVTVGLFTGLAYWNDWINALYYISKPSMFGIQNLLLRMMNNIQFLTSGQAAGLVTTTAIDIPTTGLRMAMAVIGILPILIFTPVLQKYLTKGIIIGAIKG